MNLRLISLAALVALTGCATPLERCINGVTRDMRVLDRLIATSQANLARGYALEQVVRTDTRWVHCRSQSVDKDGNVFTRSDMCLDDVDVTVLEPRAINLQDERAKLAEMQKKRRQLAKSTAPAVAQCKALHPE